MASIGWIYFSKEDKDKIGSVLDLLKLEGMVDELGMGTTRDGLSNELFPGISTIQTKAKYFFIIPYILYDYIALRSYQRKAKPILQYLEEQEYRIMWDLAKYYNYQDGCGVIGITKKYNEPIARRPSAIYWNGLYTYKFIDTHGLPANTFLMQSAKASWESLLSVPQGDDSITDDLDAEYQNIFNIRIPPKPKWRENLTVELYKDEAEIFLDRILSISKNKLIAELLQDDILWGAYRKSKDFMEFAKAAISILSDKNLKSVLVLAHDFSELMYGANLAYNIQLQHKIFNSDYFDDEWPEWVNGLEQNMLDYANFNPDAVFSYNLTTRDSTKLFVKEWWQEARAQFPDIEKRDKLIDMQEAQVKKGKARLRYNRTDDVKESKWQGLKHLDYRFSQARNILEDIRNGIDS